MNEEGHISERELLEAAKSEAILGTDELRHLDQCEGCLDRLAELVRSLVGDPSKPK